MDHRTIANLALEGELRTDRPYDDQTPSHVILANGTLAGSFDRQLLNSMAAEALRQWMRPA